MKFISFIRKIFRNIIGSKKNDPIILKPKYVQCDHTVITRKMFIQTYDTFDTIQLMLINSRLLEIGKKSYPSSCFRSPFGVFCNGKFYSKQYKREYISDKEVCYVANKFLLAKELPIESLITYISAYSGQPFKVCLRAAERSLKRGLIKFDEGRSIHSAYPTEKGMTLINGS